MKQLALLLVVCACAGASNPSRNPATTGPATAPHPVVMQPPVATGFATELTAIGLDPKNLPPLDKLAPEQLRKTMPLFAKSLGVRCEGCHASSFEVRTPRMNVAEAMWNHFVRELTTKGGEPIFCDSCHHGAVTVLDRRNVETLAVWMDQNYVGKLARKADAPTRPGAGPGEDFACPACHGEPAEMKFIRFWAEGRTFPPITPEVSHKK